MRATGTGWLAGALRPLARLALTMAMLLMSAATVPGRDGERLWPQFTIEHPAQHPIQLAQTSTEQRQLPQEELASHPHGPLSRTSEGARLPRDLSPWGMFATADLIVQFVLVGLALASVAVWTVWIAKCLELWLARRSLRRALAEFSLRRTLDEAEAGLGRRRRLTLALLNAARSELALAGNAVRDKASFKERVASRLADIEAAAGRDMRAGLGLMASVGATAPFVGLFGTVWGIMNSFIGISKAQTTNLAVVAPGIAEALLATAAGLVAAIPAVILYNQLVRALAAYRALVRENAAEVERILSRELDMRAESAAHNVARAAE